MVMHPTILKLASAGLFYTKLYDDSNPDVGMGPDLEMLLDRLTRKADVYFTAAQKREIIRHCKEKYGRRMK